MISQRIHPNRIYHRPDYCCLTPFKRHPQSSLLCSCQLFIFYFELHEQTNYFILFDCFFFQRPSFDRKLKPTTSSDSLMEGCLRQVVVPKDTMSRFLSLASKNTSKNVETCGILVGRLALNRLNITHVIVPKQHGTSDSCTTMHEEEIFDIQDQHNLITLGWIHVNDISTVIALFSNVISSIRPIFFFRSSNLFIQ